MEGAGFCAIVHKEKLRSHSTGKGKGAKSMYEPSKIACINHPNPATPEEKETDTTALQTDDNASGYSALLT